MKTTQSKQYGKLLEPLNNFETFNLIYFFLYIRTVLLKEDNYILAKNIKHSPKNKLSVGSPFNYHSALVWGALGYNCHGMWSLICIDISLFGCAYIYKKTKVLISAVK